MVKFDPRNVKEYFGFRITTENSDYYISDNGVVSGDSKYFIKHPEFIAASIKYIGSISKDAFEAISVINDEVMYKLESIKHLGPLELGCICIMGMQPQGQNLSDAEIWMRTSVIKDFHKE